MLAPDARRPFVEAVAAAMPQPVIDYVRLKLIAPLLRTRGSRVSRLSSQPCRPAARRERPAGRA